MAIETPYVPETFVGDGISTTFPISFQYQLYSDIAAFTTVVATGVITPLVYGSNYSISPLTNSPAGNGSLIFFGPLPVGTNLTIDRAVPITQLTTWTPNDPNPSTAIQDAVDKLTMIAQDLEYQVLTLPTGNSGVVTTVAFVVQAVNSPNTIVVSSVNEFAVGNTIQVSNGVLTMIGSITAINPATLTLTVTTLAIPLGTVGSNMPIGSAVQLGVVPGNNQITVQAADVISTPITGMLFDGSVAGAGAGTALNLYVEGIAAGIANVSAYIPNGHISVFNVGGVSSATGPTIFYNPTNSGAFSGATAFAPRQVAQVDATGTVVAWSLIGTNNIFSQAITPAQLMSTNSAADTQIPSYNLASGKFSWINQGGGGGLPSSGDAGQFLLGSVAWGNAINVNSTNNKGNCLVAAQGLSTNALGLGLSGTAINAEATYHNTIAGVQFNGTTWNGTFSPTDIVGPITAGNGSSTLSYYPIDATRLENAQFYGASAPNGGAVTGNIIRAGGMRSVVGFWQYAFTTNAPGTTLTVDIAAGSYRRLTGITNAVAITPADTSSAPNAANWQFANELTIEINSPGANAITWSGLVTWANGASAPTMSPTGINLVRLVRRQGQTQWVGYTDSPAGSGSYTDTQARAAVLNSTYLLPSATVQWAISAGVSAAPSLIAGSITGTYLAAGAINSSSFFSSNVIPNSAVAAGTFSTNKLILPGGTSVYMDGTGNFTTPPSSGGGGVAASNFFVPVAGGPFTTLNMGANLTAVSAGAGVLTITAAGGGGGSFSPATPYTWTATQTYQNSVIQSNFTSGSLTSSVAINAVNSGDGVQSGIAMNLSGSDGSNSLLDSSYVMTSMTSGGMNAVKQYLDVRANVNVAGFSIANTAIVQSRRLNNVNANVDCIWFNAWSPMAQYSATPDPQGIIHTWTAGGTRIGEVNYGNAWADFGFCESRNSVPNNQHVGGLEFFPDHLPGSINVATVGKFNASWAIDIGAAGAGTDGYFPQNWIGLMVDQNGISPFGVGVKIWGSVGTLNTRIGGVGASATTNSMAAALQISGTMQVGIDFAGYKGSNANAGGGTANPNTTTAATLVTDKASQQSAIMLASGQAICFKPPTGAGTGVYIWFNGTNLVASKTGTSGTVTIV